MTVIVSLESLQFFFQMMIFFYPSFVGLSERVRPTDYRTDISEYGLETALTTESEIFDADVNISEILSSGNLL